ncbi:MAG: site-2 protease family protein [Oscillospiraceae bacterium]|nr:site-2 protease family protein [Oscillospiraceae bacterium]
MDGLTSWLRQLQFDGLFETVLLVAASLLCITVHETCHGLAAYWLGDPTAKRAGRLTLNPIRHIDLMGLLMMALVRFGWAKPVPVDMRYFKNPRVGMAVTAAAGPASNVLLAFLALLLRSVLAYFCLRWPESAVLEYLLLFTWYVALISAGLAVFNLFPVPPLDGSKVLFSFLPDRAYLTLMRYERYGMLALMVLLLTGLLDAPLIILRDGLMAGLEAVTWWPLELLLGF